MIDIYYPYRFSDSQVITAGFTLPSREEVNTDGVIPGLNVGENTTASQDEIEANLQKLSEQAGFEKEQLVLGNQVHGSDVLTVSKPGFYEGYDGFVTNKTDLVLGIKVADCAALLFADEVNGVIGAAHAGWKGALAGIVPNTMDAMEQLGASSEHIEVYVSPCISAEKFEVGQEVASQFPNNVVDWISHEKPRVDLKEFIWQQLKIRGLRLSDVELDERCTMNDPQFYSYRRERERAGRMLGFIKMNKT